MNGVPPRRLRRMSSRLPYPMRRGLAKLPDPDPTPAQLRDLRERLAPLLARESRPRRPSTRPKLGRLRGTIAAALFPLAVAAGVRLVGEYRPLFHAVAPPIHVEPTTTPAPPPIQKLEPAFPEDVEPVAEPAPLELEVKRAPTPTRRSQVDGRPAPAAVETSAPEASAPPRPRGGELEMLGRAVASLASDPVKALELTTDIDRAYPDGMLRQEREVIAIKALVRLGEIERARARLEQFQSRYPRSIHYGQLKSLVP